MSASYKYSSPYAYPPQDTSSFSQRLFASSKGAWVAAGIAILYLAYNLALPSILAELLWNALVLLAPVRLVLAIDKKMNPNMYDGTAPDHTTSDTRAFKSEALRRVFGLESGPVATLPGANSLRRPSWLGGSNAGSDAPPGLGNWDNSCYQNSVLQGLSALQSLTTFLETSDATNSEDSSTTVGSLRQLMANLNDYSNNGRRIWTPAKLKSMSSWQQQDAQEYYSKIMDDMEKEMAKTFKSAPSTAGLQEIDSLDTIKASDSKAGASSDKNAVSTYGRNPLDGFLAQRVACINCGFSEGLSMIPFNCVTVPLGKYTSYKIEDCLNEYTNLEEISGVDCARCTLLRTKSQLQHMTSGPADSVDQSVPSAVSLPPEVRTMVLRRLQAVEKALEEGDVSDETLNKKCQIQKKARVSSTKTRQAVIARAPQCLAIHVNRSVFDEYTGAQMKNHAKVSYPKILNLGPWCLGASQTAADQEEWRMDPTKSMIGSSSGDTRFQYVLRAAVTHYGRHENGHYICYREHPEHLQKYEDGTLPKEATPKWWRLSDDDVSAVSEDNVLDQGGVFMLFYERMDLPAEKAVSNAVQETPQENVMMDMPAEVEVEPRISEPEKTEDKENVAPKTAIETAPEMDVENTLLLAPEAKKMSTPQTMRTAGNKARRRKRGLSTLQTVAAI